eukprot:3608190-Rhodomonas_salina.1
MHDAIQQADYYLSDGQFSKAEQVLLRAVQRGGDKYSAGMRLFEAGVKKVNAVHQRFWDAMNKLVFVRVDSNQLQRARPLKHLADAKAAL